MHQTAPFTPEQIRILNNTQVLFHGAGPVGLWSAIQTALHMQDQGKEAKITFIERYPTYLREHALWVNPSWFRSVMHPKTNIPGLTDQKKPVQIRANQLEHLLFEYAQSLGIQVIRSDAFKTWTDRHLRIEPDDFWRRWDFEEKRDRSRQAWFNQILEHCPNVDRLVGTDGAHSPVRTHFFTAQPLQKKIIRRVVQLSLTIDLSQYPTLKIDSAYPTTSIFDFKALGHVDATDQHRTTVTARFFVDSATFNRFQKPGGGLIGNAASPLTGENLLEHPLLTPKLKRSLSRWTSQIERKLSASLEHPYKVDINQAKLTTILLEHTKAPTFWKTIQRNERPFDIVIEGDAREFTPFYSSLNSSFRTACWLGKALAVDNPQKRAPLLQAYVNKTHRHQRWLSGWLWFKNIVLTFLSWLQSLGYMLSLTLRRWSFNQASNMHFTSDLKRPNMGLKGTRAHEAELRDDFLVQFGRHRAIATSPKQVNGIKAKPKTKRKTGHKCSV